jgi:serine/alanine racemase
MKRNSSIDSFRIIAAILIVFLHVPQLYLVAYENPIWAGVMCIARLAVPFFFVVSGYYLFSKNAHDIAQKSLRAAKKLLALILVSFLIYAVIGIIMHTINIEDYLNPFSYVKLLIFNYPKDLIGVKMLWFLPALLYINLIFYLGAKYCKKHYAKIITALGIVGFLVGIIISTYSAQIFGKTLATPSFDNDYLIINFFCHGLIFFCIGFLTKACANKLAKISTAKILCGSIISILLLLTEFFVRNDYDQPLYIMLPVTIFFVLQLLVRYPGFLRNTAIPTLGAKYAVSIYIYQVIFREIAIRGLKILHIEFANSTINGLVILILTVGFALLFGIATSRLKKVLKPTKRLV